MGGLLHHEVDRDERDKNIYLDEPGFMKRSIACMHNWEVRQDSP